MKRKGGASFRSYVYSRTLIVPGLLLLTLIGLSILSLLIQKSMVGNRFTKTPQSYLPKELTYTPKPTIDPRFQEFDPNVITQLKDVNRVMGQTGGPLEVGGLKHQLNLYRLDPVEEKFSWCNQKKTLYGVYYLGAFYIPQVFSKDVGFQLFAVEKLGLLPFDFNGVVNGMFTKKVLNKNPVVETAILTILFDCHNNKTSFFTINPVTTKIEQIKFQSQDGSVTDQIDIPVRYKIPQSDPQGNIIGDTFLDVGPDRKEVREKTRYKFDFDQFKFIELESWIQKSS